MQTKTHLSLFFQLSLILCLFLFPETVRASQKPSGRLLQFEAGSHILGFEKNKVYVASGDHMLKIDFIGTEGVDPTAIHIETKDVTREAEAQPLREVAYNNLWPGIDLSYKASTGGIAESIWTIEPGANPDKIRMQYNTHVQIANDGSLKMSYQSGWMRESQPIAWQSIDGQRIAVDVQFRIIADKNINSHIGFKLGHYNKKFPLLIDPIMQWNTFIGAYYWDVTYSMTVDDTGNVYVVGRSYQDWGDSVNAHSGSGSNDGVVVKLDGAGAVIWNTFMGTTSSNDLIYGVDIDSSGNVYLCGYSENTWGTPIRAHSGNYDAFVAKLDSAGARQWHTFLGSASGAYGYGVAVDNAGDIFASGRSDGTWGTPINAYAGGQDIFLAKLNNTGTLQWHTFMGSASDDAGRGISIDDSGNVLLAGYSQASWGTPVNAHTGAWDAVAAKLNTAGALQWHTFMGSATDDRAIDIKLDSSGDIVVGGYGGGTWGAPVNSYAGGTDAFVAKLDSSGNLLWNTFMGSASDDSIAGISIDSSDNIYAGGTSGSGWGAAPLSAYSGGYDAFAAQLNNSGILQWNSFMGATAGNYDYGGPVGVDCAGNAFIAGTSDGSTWGTPLSPFINTSMIFVQRIGNPGHAVCSTAPANEGSFTPAFRLVADSMTTTFEINSETGYVLNTITGCDGNWTGVNPYTTGSITGNCKVEATFTPNISYTVSATIDAHGSLDAASVSTNHNATASFTITPDQDYIPSTTVTGDCPAGTWSDYTYTTGAITAACTVNFSTTPAVTITPSTGSNGTVSPDTAQIVPVGSTTQFTITPDSGYSASVAGTCGGTLVGDTYTTVAVTVDCTVEATFVAVHTVNASVDQNGSLDQDSATVNVGDTASFTVTPDFGFSTDSTVSGNCPAGSWNTSTYTTGAITTTCSLSFTNSPVGISTVTPTPESPARLISSGDHHSLALKADGVVMAWGDNSAGQTTIPGTLSTVTAVAAGAFFSMALQTDGTVAAWGINTNGQTTIPAGLSTVKAIAAGGSHSLALKEDGTVVAWGSNASGQTSVPAGLSDVVAIAGGDNHSLALLGTGTVIGWGHNFSGQATPPAGLTNVTAISAGRLHSLALKSDGTLVAWGSNDAGQITIPSGLIDVMAIAAGYEHSLAVKNDGTVVAWGANTGGQTNVPAGLSDALAVAGGQFHSSSLQNDGTIVAWGYNATGQTTIPASLNLLPFAGSDGTVLPNVPQSVIDGTTTQFTMIPRAGYAASVGGTCGGALVGNIFTTAAVTEDCTVEASFAPGGHTVTATVDENGSLNISSVTVSDGTTASFTVTPEPGFATDQSVGGTCSTGFWSGQIYTTGAITATCTVDFTHSPEVTVTPSAGEHGSIAPDTPQVIPQGATTSFTIIPDIGGYQIDSVTGCDGSLVGNTYTTGSVTANCSVTATFTFNPTVAVPAHISAGDFHNVIIKTDGTLWAWGDNEEGQLGDGTVIDKYEPVQIGVETNWQSAAAGRYHSLAIKADDTLWAWGNNFAGQLGDGTTTEKNSPVQIGTDNNWRSIITGSYHTLAIKTNGTLWAWGYNDRGQLGDGTIVNKSSPVQIGIETNWRTIAGGESHSLAIKEDGTLWAWGANEAGQLGDESSLDKILPVQVGTANNWQNVSAGGQHTVSTAADGTLWAWGANHLGQVGDGTDINRNIPVQVGVTTDWKSISSGSQFNVAIRTDGSLWAWGNNDYGQLGDGTTTAKNIPGQLDSASNWQSISSADGHTIAIKADGSLWTWGTNGYGELGIGTHGDDKIAPVLNLIASNWQQVSSFSGHGAGIKTDGTLWTWGNNNVGQLGIGTFDNKSMPIQVTTSNDWESVAAGKRHTIAVKTNGTLWAMGHNYYGQLGDGSYNNKDLPVQVGMATNWQTVAAGDGHSLAIKTDGTLWAWGYNYYGQLGDATSNNKSIPTQVGTAIDWETIAVGESHSLAIKTTGTLWAWGCNYNSRLGDGTTTHSSIPIQITSNTNWRNVAGGTSHTLATQTNGTLWAWGGNYNGQIGDGTTTQRTVPKQIGSATNWLIADGGEVNSAALKTDGTIWSWGENNRGQVGDGTTGADETSPVQINTDTNWQKVMVGEESTLAIKTDGTLWAWGMTWDGRHGDGTGWRDLPVEILYGATPNDINLDGTVDLTDAVLALQVLSGVTPSEKAYAAADLDGDGKVGLAEVVYSLQKAGQL